MAVGDSIRGFTQVLCRNELNTCFQYLKLLALSLKIFLTSLNRKKNSVHVFKGSHSDSVAYFFFSAVKDSAYSHKFWHSVVNKILL